MGRTDATDPSSTTNPDPKVSLDVLPLHSTNLLTVLDKNGIIQYESPSIKHVYGFEQDQLVGDPVTDYFHPDDRERVLTAFQHLVTSDGPDVKAVEYRHEQADGTYTWVESVASATPTPNGYYVVNTRDISDQKEREQRLLETNERLNEFASVVSHDIRNPLSIAEGHLELATEECESDHLEQVSDALDRIHELITDLLTLSQQGEPIGATEDINLNELVKSCWTNVDTGDATLVTDTEATIRADRSRLQQLLENIVRNAVENGGEEVTVSIGDLHDGFYVADDGPGIPDAERDNIFDQGYSRTEGGTGFGLAIVQNVALAHEWEVEVTEGNDGGARFEITGIDLTSSPP